MGRAQGCFCFDRPVRWREHASCGMARGDDRALVRPRPARMGPAIGPLGWLAASAREWGAAFEGARCEIAAIVNALRPHVTVKLAAGDEVAAQAARERLGSACTVHTLPTGDIWLRDTGPVFIDQAGRIEAVCFDFNGWGGKFIMPGDDATAEAIAAAEALRAWHHPFVLEGGAVECDGTGTAITTRSCLLNANRNPGWDTRPLMSSA